MTVTIKPLTEPDFFGWYALFAAYAASAGVTVTDEGTMRVWTALHGDSGSGATAHGVLATDETGEAVGMAHFSGFERLLQGDSGYVVEDLFVAEGARRHGVATALIEHVRTRAEAEHRGSVRWVTNPDDDAAKALYEKFAPATGDWAMYDLSVS